MTIICPKCKEVVTVKSGKDYVICKCGEVICIDYEIQSGNIEKKINSS